MAAYLEFWRRRGGGGGRGAAPGQPPRCQLMTSVPMHPWRLWQEVHSWGGPEVVTAHKVGHGAHGKVRLGLPTLP